MTTTRRRFLAATAAAISADLVSKVLAVVALSGTSVDLQWIELRLVRNDGISFGLGNALPPLALVFVTGLVVVLLAAGVWRGAIPAGVSSGLIVGGATANVLDRLTDGSVIDMLDIGWWPAFNFADVLIVSGAGFLLMQEIPRSVSARSDS